jgi:glycerol-3-phosphate dehydrogenase (NAD(P)+)
MKISIIGNGAWGSALAAVSRQQSHPTFVWGRHPKEGETANLKEAVDSSEIMLLSVPSHAMREVCSSLKSILPPKVLLVSLAKGIEQDTHLRMSEVIQEITNRTEIAVMSGPTFAAEVIHAAPTAIVCASLSESLAKTVQTAFNSEAFRVYTNQDVVGVEFGGALKNIMAIAAGVCVGMGLGDNALAALITRGLAELSRVGQALGGRAETFYGLSGVGDLILTCSSSQSRNRRVGEALGRGEKLPQILASLKGTAEGVKTARSVHQILQQKNLDAPILQEIYSVLYEEKPVRDAVKSLMGREPKSEFVKK